MKRILQKLNLDVGDLAVEDAMLRAERAYHRRGTEILQFEKYHIFDYMQNDIARIRDKIAEDGDLIRYCYFLSEILETGDSSAIASLSSPCKDRKDEMFDLLPLFGLLDRIPDMVRNLRARCVPEDVVLDTCKMFQNQVQDFVDLHHRYGISDYVLWLWRFLQCRIIRVGRFNLEMTLYQAPFEILTDGNRCVAIPNGLTFHKSGRVLGSVGCEATDGSFDGAFWENDSCFSGLVTENGLCKRETAQYAKSEWRLAVTRGTPVISVHIPSGGPLSPDVCERDLARGKELINRCFGEYRHFYCKSWLMDPQLGDLLNQKGNLFRFAERFLRFPAKSQGRAVFTYAYQLPADTPPERLPEHTTLAKAVKKHLCAGGHIYESCGIIVDGEV